MGNIAESWVNEWVHITGISKNSISKMFIIVSADVQNSCNIFL